MTMADGTVTPRNITARSLGQNDARLSEWSERRSVLQQWRLRAICICMIKYVSADALPPRVPIV